MVVALVLATLSSLASASWTLSAVGSRTSVASGGGPAVFSYTPGTNLPGLSAELEIQSGQNLELGIGLLGLTRAFNDGNTGNLLSHVMEGELALRWWLGSLVALGGGGYFATNVGALQLANGGQSIAFIDYGLKAWDYGPFGTVALAIPISKFHLIAEARLTWSAANQARGTGVSFRVTDELFLIGLRFGMGASSRGGQ